MEDYSVWSEVHMPEFSRLQGELRTDVLIVGGGIAGLLTAYELTHNGINCAVVERHRICRGTTLGTTAKITFQHGLIYRDIAERYGLETAAKYLAANKQAFRRIAALAQKIDCDFKKEDNYIYSRNNRRALELELSTLEKLRFPAKLCECDELPFATVGALKFPNQAAFNPLKFLRAIAQQLKIYENTNVLDVRGNVVQCDGAVIYAKKTVIASHFPFIDRVGAYFLKMYQSRSSVIALENATQPNGLFMDENKNGFSFRNYGNLLLIGGGAHRTGEPCRLSELREFAEKNYPKSVLKYSWSAQDCITLDGMPYIGQYSTLTPNLYVATGFNKWGITSSMAAATLLTELILNGKSEFSDVFDPSRSIFNKQLLVNGFNAAKDLISVNAPRCPHMGCALKRNRAEHSWDCPCHGSRFSADGDLLEGPANRNAD